MFSLVLYLSRFLSELFVVLFFGFSFFLHAKLPFDQWPQCWKYFPKEANKRWNYLYSRAVEKLFFRSLLISIVTVIFSTRDRKRESCTDWRVTRARGMASILERWPFLRKKLNRKSVVLSVFCRRTD